MKIILARYVHVGLCHAMMTDDESNQSSLFVVQTNTCDGKSGHNKVDYKWRRCRQRSSRKRGPHSWASMSCTASGPEAPAAEGSEFE